MKVLIVYASKSGTAKDAAEMLVQGIIPRSDVELFDVEDAPAPDGYDVVVLGGSIRMARLDKRIKKYIAAHSDTISKIHSAAFICCGISKDFEDYVVMELPKSCHFSLGIYHFGGRLKPERLSGFERLVVKMFREHIKTQDPDTSDMYRDELPELLPDTINALAQKISALR